MDTDYSLNNPDTLTKYKSAAQISQKVLEAVSGETAPNPLRCGPAIWLDVDTDSARMLTLDRMVH